MTTPADAQHRNHDEDAAALGRVGDDQAEDEHVDEHVEEDVDEHVEEDGDDAAVAAAVKLSVGLLAAIAVCVGGFFAIKSLLKEPPPPPPEIASVAVREAVAAELPSIPWADITAAAGIDFVHENGARGQKLLPETMGGGVAWLDHDGDGFDDLLLVGSATWDGSDEQPSLALYRNAGDGTFEDITAAVGLDLTLYGMGCAVGDYDGDGDADLYITALGPNRLLRRDGDRYVDVTDATGTAGGDDDWTTAAGFLDYDRDGDLDLVAVNYLDWSAEYDTAQNFRITGDQRGYGRPQNFGGTAPLLFRNDGADGDGNDGVAFSEVAEDAGLHIRNPDTQVPAMKSLGLGIDDFNGDGWLDLLVANDTVRNCLFLNRQDGTFAEAGIASGVAFDDAGHARGAMGVDVARFRDDDSLGVVIGNFANEMTALYVDPYRSAAFSDEAVASGLGPQTRLLLTFGVLFLDADLDGRLDIACANGHLDEDIALVQESQRYEQPPQLFWNAGDAGATEFVPLGVDQLGEAYLKPMVGRAVAAADIDLDGDPDLVMTQVGGPPRLLRNDVIRPDGRESIRLTGFPIGTRITLNVPGEAAVERVVNPTRGYLSQSSTAVLLTVPTSAAAGFAFDITLPDGRTVTLARADLTNRIAGEGSPLRVRFEEVTGVGAAQSADVSRPAE